MASTYSELGIELMATGENAGTWGTKTNANLNLVEQISGGYVEQSIAGGAQTTNLLVADGALTGKAQNRIIKLTGSITGNQVVTLPVNLENFYIINNATTDGAGTPTVQIKAISGSGATVTWAAGEKGFKILYSDGVATNTGIFDTGFSTTDGDVTLTGTQTLTNKTLTSPKITTSILDSNGNQLFLLTATGSAVNEFTVANAATGGDPTLSATGDDSNIDIAIKPKGTGETVFGTGAAAATLTTSGAHDLVLDTNSGTNSGTVTITDGANADMTVAPNGYGRFTVDGQGKIASVAEKVTVEATAATGTVNYDVLAQAVWYFTSNASGNWTLNFRGSVSTTLNTIMDTGESITVAHLVTNGSSAKYNSAVQIDGSGVTPEWQGGAAPSAGNANSVDVYTYTIIKTGDATFKVFAAQTQFA
tara:strand:+ start:1250 stop:2509 length:1260 start_codon:yes stop_codon:yes gene_type:complete